jgi:hypothetical protein
MVVCIIALPVLLIMGIFSMRYRILAKEAFECIFNMVTLRPCKSKLDQRIKASLTGKIMKHHQGFARWVFKNFAILSWIFVIIFAVSLAFSVWGVYNYAVYGNCNGPTPGAFCVFNEVEKGVGAIEGAIKCNTTQTAIMNNANTS